MKQLLDILIEAGYPKIDVFHHCSDLYIFVTPLTTKIVTEWCNKNNTRLKLSAPTFRDEITGRLMYDIAFQYYPYFINHEI